MSEEKYWSLVGKQLSGNLSDDEQKELELMLDDDPAKRTTHAQLQEIWNAAENYPQNFEVDTQAAWKSVRKSIGHTPTEKVSIRTLSSFQWLRIAAMFLVIVTTAFAGWWFYNQSQAISIVTKAGEQKEVILPDGSQVWLNELSAITYPANLHEAGQREVELRGEAFFEVTRNPQKKFVVQAGKTLTQVLGTSFNVKVEPKGKGVTVSVITGKVSFKPVAARESELILLPGDRGKYADGTMRKTRFSNENFLFWKDGELKFENTPVSQVLKELETSYGVAFSLGDSVLASKKITTSFKGNSIDQVVEVLGVLLDVEFKKTGQSYVVKK